MPNFRHAETRRGDTLKRIALRELGHADQWVELALLNGLRPPYLVDDEENRTAGVLVAGDLIKIPSAMAMADAETNPEQLFGRDLAVFNKLLQADDHGDLALVGGVANLKQALLHRLLVRKRELAFHPAYGNFAAQLIGRANGPTGGSLAAFYMRSAMLEEPRVKEVPRSEARIEGDAIRVDADVAPISGRPFKFSEVI